METLQTFDTFIDLANDQHFHLSIQVSKSSISYAILDLSQHTYIALKQIYLSDNELLTDVLENLYATDKHLAANFKSTIVQYQSFRAMLVPETLFDAKNLKAFLKFHSDVDEKDHINFVDLKPAEAFIIFSIPAHISDFFTQKHTNLKFSHSSIPFIHNALVYRDVNENSACLHIHMAKDFFDLLIVRNNKIQLFNSFFYKKYTDVIYFIVNVLNLFSIVPGHSKVYVSGEVDETSELESELAKILKPIHFEQYNLDVTYAEGFQKLQQHKFINLLNVHNCGL